MHSQNVLDRVARTKLRFCARFLGKVRKPMYQFKAYLSGKTHKIIILAIEKEMY